MIKTIIVGTPPTSNDDQSDDEGGGNAPTTISKPPQEPAPSPGQSDRIIHGPPEWVQVCANTEEARDSAKPATKRKRDDDELDANVETTTVPVSISGFASGQEKRAVLSKRKLKAIGSLRKRNKSKNAARAEVVQAAKAAKRYDEANGYVDESKQSWRTREGGRSAVDGNQRSCSQDALVNGAKRLGVPVTKKAACAAALPPTGDTKVSVIFDYARHVLGIEMLNCRKLGVLDDEIFMSRGGPEHAILQIIDGKVFFVLLNVDDDKHVVVYDSGYDCYSGETRGAIIDNSKDSSVKHIDPMDRAFKKDENGNTVLSKKGKPVPAGWR